jgi:hypothetical protein
VQLIIITNGSYKPDNWWHGLGKVLNHNDELHWSIDGWDHDSNVQYRVNSNWPSIMSGISAFQSSNNSTYRVWAAIAFKFNQDHIDVQRTLANQLNFDCYQLTLSTKFHSKYPEIYSANDHLEPDNKQFVAVGHRFQRDNTVLSTKVRPGAELVGIFLQRAQALSRQNTHSGICMIGNKGVFLNSRGEFYPVVGPLTDTNTTQIGTHWQNLNSISIIKLSTKSYKTHSGAQIFCALTVLNVGPNVLLHGCPMLNTPQNGKFYTTGNYNITIMQNKNTHYDMVFSKHSSGDFTRRMCGLCLSNHK